MPQISKKKKKKRKMIDTCKGKKGKAIPITGHKDP
jgi:hypothetical protein